MSFSVDDPYELIQIANSLDTGASESTLMLLMYMIQRFGELGTTVNQFPNIPRDEFDSVVRDDFEPRLLEVGTDSTSTGESLIGVAMTLKEFHDRVPQVKSAAANLEQVLSQSSSPAEWKSAAEPLASALNNLYSVSVPSAPSTDQTLAALAKAKASYEAEDGSKPPASEAGKQQDGSVLQQPSGSPAPAQQPASSATNSKPQANQSSQEGNSGSGGSGSPSGGGGESGGSGGGSGGSPAAAPASGPASPPASDAGKKGTNAAATLSDSPFTPLASTGLQSADLLPSSSGLGLGGGGVGGAGLDPRALGSAPGSAANPASSAGIPGAGPAGAARGMSAMMGGMMGPGMMGGRGGAGDKEHKAPDYLYSEDNGYELIEKLPVVSPDVIGALTEEEIETLELHTDFAYSDQA
ncbi:hypothetical protein [Segniliparus rugosus]|uniref:Uncharacterized protein n=1 Tax=Segniliparus rugosus (strain ATCC BAA-974 / DSM 45345 / CCUG 50838 / CIP 108380 / JCM 13579 / CDC 945) TaxID=679197 RepID=E5XRF1_SEGRC|nr:hypothetical protein [Segniliparus rugosus]EFV13084.1 hypothetical protein HMPREF9336_02073 [Segniliparus rugosus ATCC BAA-974]